MRKMRKMRKILRKAISYTNTVNRLVRNPIKHAAKAVLSRVANPVARSALGVAIFASSVRSVVHRAISARAGYDADRSRNKVKKFSKAALFRGGYGGYEIGKAKKKNKLLNATAAFIGGTNYTSYRANRQRGQGRLRAAVGTIGHAFHSPNPYGAVKSATKKGSR